MYQPSAVVRHYPDCSGPPAPRGETTSQHDARPAALISRLERELTSLSSAAIHALTSIQQTFDAKGTGGAEPGGESTERLLSLAAEALESALTAHQALQARIAAVQEER
ncbi:hypothetical protein GCM10009772_32250 [Pseudonocardia alni subsp. carboxydivorans]|jgi:hypothetical protein